jgi:hypothetical protein
MDTISKLQEAVMLVLLMAGTDERGWVSTAWHIYTRFTETGANAFKG